MFQTYANWLYQIKKTQKQNTLHRIHPKYAPRAKPQCIDPFMPFNILFCSAHRNLNRSITNKYNSESHQTSLLCTQFNQQIACSNTHNKNVGICISFNQQTTTTNIHFDRVISPFKLPVATSQTPAQSISSFLYYLNFKAYVYVKHHLFRTKQYTTRYAFKCVPINYR